MPEAHHNKPEAATINQNFLPTDKYAYLAPNTIGVDEENRPKPGVRVGTIGDGSCFFHSICLALNKHEIWLMESYVESNKEERQKISKTLRTYLSEALTSEDYEDVKSKLDLGHNSKADILSFDNLKLKLLDPKYWANELIIRWTSKCLNINIIFLNLMENAMFCNVHHSQITKSLNCKSSNGCGGPTQTIIVAWVKHQHFELIGAVEKTKDKHVIVRVIFTNEDVKQIMKKYFSQCPI